MRALLIPAAAVLVALAIGAGAATALIKDEDDESGSSSATRAAVRGPAGPRGPAGAPGIAAARLRRVAAYTDYGAGEARTGHAEAVCPAGKRVIGGGGRTAGAPGTITDSYPSADLSRWVVSAIRAKSREAWRVTAYAVCVAR